METVSGAVTVRQLATGISVSPTSANQCRKDNQTIISNSNTKQIHLIKGVTWTSSNTGVATVSSSGLVTAKAAGTATITVKHQMEVISQQLVQ